MKRGTIILAKFPFTDLSGSKRRPAIVLSPSSSKDGDFIVAFISSKTDNLSSKYDLLLNISDSGFAQTGLKQNSIIRMDKLATLHTSVISGELGSLPKTRIGELNTKLELALGLR